MNKNMTPSEHEQTKQEFLNYKRRRKQYFEDCEKIEQGVKDGHFTYNEYDSLMVEYFREYEVSNERKKSLDLIEKTKSDVAFGKELAEIQRLVLQQS
jgi:hypothetical protein